jgi:hypothetical protein
MLLKISQLYLIFYGTLGLMPISKTCSKIWTLYKVQYFGIADFAAYLDRGYLNQEYGAFHSQMLLPRMTMVSSELHK